MYRKASTYSAQTVHAQKNKKIGTETFLYNNDEDIIDTDMLVAPLQEAIASRGEEPETIGTMELRLSITRQLGVSYTIGDVQTYSDLRGSIEEETEHTISYKQVAPTFQMSFEKNSAPLDRTKASRELRRMDTARPGTEPWAIFRFHYRSKGEIT